MRYPQAEIGSPDVETFDANNSPHREGLVRVIKVVLLIPTLDRSGAEKQFTYLATRLPKDEFSVHVVALTRGGPYEQQLQEHQIPLTVLNKRFKLDPFALTRLKRVIGQVDPDVLHTWLFAANAYGRYAVGSQPRAKVVVSERCVDTWKSGWQLSIDRRLAGRTTRLIGNSEGVAEFYRDRGVPNEKTVVIPNGIELPSGPAVDRAQVLQEFQIPPEADVIGYVGRLAPQKRLRDVVWAIQLLKQLRDRVYLLLVGDGPERARLERLAKHMGCSDLVRFAGHRDDVQRLMQVMSVVWLASDFEGMSNSLMEAMANSIPVVASDIPPNRELVVDGETGFLVAVKDSVGMAQFTDRILGDADLAARLGRAGRARIESEFSVDSMVAAHANLYREIVSRS